MTDANTMVELLEPFESEMRGIVNPYGKFWTHQTFYSEEEARSHVRSFWPGADEQECVAAYTIIPVIVTIRARAAGRREG